MDFGLAVIEQQLRDSGSMSSESATNLREEVECHLESLLDALDRLRVSGEDNAAVTSALDAAQQIKEVADRADCQIVSGIAEQVVGYFGQFHHAPGSSVDDGLEWLCDAPELLFKLLSGDYEFEELSQALHTWHSRVAGITNQDLSDAQNRDSAKISSEDRIEENDAQVETTTFDQLVDQIHSGRNVDPALQDIYAEEAEEHLRTIYQGLRQLEAQLEDFEALGRIRRSAHTLKGAAGAVGIEAVVQLSHRMEDLLDALADKRRPPTKDQLDLLLQTADALQGLAAPEIDVPETASLMAELYRRFEGEMAHFGSLRASTAGEAANNVSTDSEANENSAVVGTQDHASAPTSFTGEASSKSTQTSATQADRTEAASQYLRVPLSRLDSLVGLVGEMVVNRSAFHQRLSDFEARIDDMQVSISRLRNVATEMETRHSVEALQTSMRQNSASQSVRNDLDALEFDRYTDIHLLTRSLSEVSNDVAVIGNELRNLYGDFDSLLNRQQRFNRDAQDSLIHIRMVPLQNIVNRLSRTVRTVANKLGKQIALHIEGEQTELDKTVLEDVVDPLLHLLRNSVDHGIELPAERAQTGKSAVANVRVEALNQGTQVTLRVSDDGRGIDLEKIRTKALERGLIAESDRLSDEQLQELIFTPGFSTANELTQVSGRGVGMDVVRDAVQRLKGTISVESQLGQGTRFTIHLPTTLAVTRALLVESLGQRFALPMQSIQQMMRSDPLAVHRIGDKPCVQIGDASLAITDLAQHLQLRSDEGPIFDQPLPMLVIRSGDNVTAITVDSVVGGQDIVVKTLGDHLRSVPGYLGATIAGDGTVIPILDPSDLCGKKATAASPRSLPLSEPIRASRTNLAMVIDDSLSVRRVTSNLLRKHGWEVLEAKDGVDALEKLAASEIPPDIFLCDMEMPRMDGLELISRIRTQIEFAATPIAMVTSRASEKHRRLAAEAGADEHVVKPFNDEQLMELVTQMVARYRETVLV